MNIDLTKINVACPEVAKGQFLINFANAVGEEYPKEIKADTEYWHQYIDGESSLCDLLMDFLTLTKDGRPQDIIISLYNNEIITAGLACPAIDMCIHHGHDCKEERGYLLGKDLEEDIGMQNVGDFYDKDNA